MQAISLSVDRILTNDVDEQRCHRGRDASRCVYMSKQSMSRSIETGKTGEERACQFRPSIDRVQANLSKDRRLTIDVDR